MPNPETLSIDEATPLATKLGGVSNPSPQVRTGGVQGTPSQNPDTLTIEQAIPLSQIRQLPRLGGYQNPATQRPEFSNVLNRLATSLIPGVTGALGEVIGAPGGPAASAAAGAVGTGIGQYVSGPIREGRLPQSSDISDALKAAGISTGLSFIGNIPGIIRGQIAKSAATKAGKAAGLVEEARQVATGGIPTPANVEQAQNVLSARLAPVKAEETAAWNKVTQHAVNNTRSVPVKIGQTPGPNPTPIFNNQSVEGAIPLSQDTLNYIRDTQAELATSVGPLNPQMSQAARTLNQVTRDIVTDGQTGVSYIPFAGAKQLRTDLGQAYTQQMQKSIVAPGQKIGIPYGTMIGTKLRATLGDDIENGVANWGNEAIQDYGAAGEATKTAVKSSVLFKSIARNTDPANGTLKVNNIINDLQKETSQTGKVFSAADRDKLVGLFQATRNVSPSYPSTGTFKGQNWVLSGASLATGHPGSAVYFGTKQFVKNLLEGEPTLARIAAQMPSAPANSPQAKMLTTSFLKKMPKGVAASIVTQSGRILSGHTDGNGDVVPDFQSQ